MITWGDALQRCGRAAMPPELVDCNGLQFCIVMYVPTLPREFRWLAIANGRTARADSPELAVAMAIDRARIYGAGTGEV